MLACSSETTPLVLEKQNDAVSPCAKALLVIYKGFESVLDWSPFIVVQSLYSSSFSPTAALGAGTLAAVFVIFYAFFKHTCFPIAAAGIRNKFQPKVLDLGQFFLFGFLYLSALWLAHVSSSSSSGQLLVLWFNAFTTGGIALIMWTSIAVGRPFLFDYVEAQVSPALWERLSSRKFVRDILIEMAMFWVRVLCAMTLIVTIQPLIVTVFYEGDVKNDSTGRMVKLGNVLTAGQLVIMCYGVYRSARMEQQQSANKKRIRHVKQHGFSPKQEALYSDVAAASPLQTQTNDHHRIRTLTKDTEFTLAAPVLADAFSNDPTFYGVLGTSEGKLNFFLANIKALARFHQVLACFDKNDERDGDAPKCVMVCLPVLTKSQEEIHVFNSYVAWKEHGFALSGATETEFLLPEDDVYELLEMKNEPKYGLTKKPYLYVAFFGADSAYRGKGYGRSLLKHIVHVSEARNLPLVLETATAFNTAQYEKYGFRIVHRVTTKPEWVLMVRSCMGKSGNNANV